MSFSNLGKDYIKEGFTMVDNIFLSSYITTADPTYSQVYLYGLFSATLDDNSIEKMAISLKLSEGKITEAYRYWEKLGLVTISRVQPLKVTYNSVKKPITPTIKYNATEFSVFVEEMARIFPDKVLGENELMSYVELMKQYKMKTNAMLMIATYCLEVKAVASTPYIIAVANDWLKQGIVTEEAVAQHIEDLEQNGEDIRQIFVALGIKSQAGLEDRQRYLTWTKVNGFKLDGILVACRMCKKRGGMDKLNKIMSELINAGATTASEIQEYAKNKEANLQLATDVINNIGGYYASYDMVIETYILPWLAKGFEKDALISISKYCFKSNIKTLDKVDSIVERFYKLGLLSTSGIEKYIARQIAIDTLIREVLDHAGSNNFISYRDREFYRTFQEEWGFEHSTILLVADNCVGKPYPMTHINRMLADLKANNIFDPTAVAGYLAVSATTTSSSKKGKGTIINPKEDYLMHDYTKEQIGAVFSNLDDIDVLGGKDE